VRQATANCGVASVREEGEDEEDGGSDIGPPDDAGHGFGVDGMGGEETTRYGRG